MGEGLGQLEQGIIQGDDKNAMFKLCARFKFEFPHTC